MGLECAIPGMGVCQRMFSPVSTFHVVGNGRVASMPAAAGPRYCGQSAATIGINPASDTNTEQRMSLSFNIRVVLRDYPEFHSRFLSRNIDFLKVAGKGR